MSEPFVTIYHNPHCGTSRNTLAMIHNAGLEPHIVEYLEDMPAKHIVSELIRRAGLTVREALRQKGTPYGDLGLANPALTDDELLDTMQRFPILLNRPFVVTPKGVRLCRPSEVVLEILPAPQLVAFKKEDGEVVVDKAGHYVGKHPLKEFDGAA